jgi:hypothetical protein
MGRPFAGFGAPAQSSNPEVTALQQSLVKVGRNVPVTGVINDPTVASLWVLLGADLTKAKTLASLVSSEASTFVGWFADTINWINNQVSQIPGGVITVDRVLNNWVNINSVLGAICSAASSETCTNVVAALDNARTSVFNGIASKAGVIKKIVDLFGAPPGTSTTTPPKKNIRDQIIAAGAGKLDPNKLTVWQPSGPSYPAGSIARYNTTRKVWSIYKPVAHGLGISVSGVDGCMFGECNTLGGAPKPPAGYVLLTTASTPAGATVATPSTEKDTSTWWIWVLGAGVVGAAGVVIYRRRRR